MLATINGSTRFKSISRILMGLKSINTEIMEVFGMFNVCEHPVVLLSGSNLPLRNKTSIN